MIDKADTYCGKCIKTDVCGMEGVYDPATTYCAYRVIDRPHGEWYYSCKNGWHCSICQQIVKDMPTVMGKANFDYCPNCGADMRKEGEEK